MKKYIIPYFVPHVGCPVGCVFCNQNEITGIEFTGESLKETVLENISYFKIKNPAELAFYGGSFTAINPSLRSKLLTEAKSLIDEGLISEVRISTRPDCIDEKILEELKENGVKTIELGVQSLDIEVLKLSNRGHDPECVYTSSDLIKKWNFNLGLQQMIGLPGDTYTKSIHTAEEFVKIGPSMVRIYPTLVVKNTRLEKMYKSGVYKPLCLESAIDLSKDLLKIYRENNIDVIRIGLQPTENINFDGDLVAGPFHPSFRQLVEEKLIVDKLTKYRGLFGASITIEANGRNISYIAGNKGINKQKACEALGAKEIKLRLKNLDSGILLINGEKIII